VDWWTLGILLFEMLTGLPPFYSEDQNEMYQRILEEDLTFPMFVAPLARDILTKLLEKDPRKRLGVNGAQEIKDHDFFHDIDWIKLMQKRLKPPTKPKVVSANLQIVFLFFCFFFCLFFYSLKLNQ
jgi:serum/glucocorticoid-regulated kinase 2